jgi:ubiquinone/menaquinone biosynthesis C-methylase UbiE
MESIPLKKSGDMVWVDVGGGTARNLEFFTAATLRKYFKSITIVDISASLLEIAKRRCVYDAI